MRENEFNNLDYAISPVADKPLIQQIEYWQERARFFEEKAYELAEKLQDINLDDSGDWWKKDE